MIEAVPKAEVVPYPPISNRIQIVNYQDGGARVTVEGQDITGWIAADSDLAVRYAGPNRQPTLTLTLTAAKITARNDTRDRTTRM
ncbi:hypothetical protein [Microbacterium sp. K5D]|uniref:hypothetical protein n=1 Tax=Microbacterium sp. K5D TaxID=2305436 RepID=UPI00109D0E4A|nr:hypothetical protein [Microbacterium sp. K5D]